LIVSHVLTELDEREREQLLRTARRAEAILWVEPGTHRASRDLIGVRERLREDFRVLAPCTHQGRCGLLAPGNERHWCHNFADAPPGIMGDSTWVRFARRAGIDLRSLPYSFLAMEKAESVAPPLGVEGCSRIIGEPRYYKGYARVFSCQEDGVRELTLRKRDAPVLFKALKGGGEAVVYRWELPEGRIIGGRRPGEGYGVNSEW
jgi:ribosomal protein RSM22 (predicted rRNA methylase)